MNINKQLTNDEINKIIECIVDNWTEEDDLIIKKATTASLISAGSKGRKHSKETIIKLRISHLNQKPTPEAIAKTVLKIKGLKRSKESKERMSISAKKSITDLRLKTAINNLKKARSARYRKISINGKKYDTVKDAADELSLNQNTITVRLKSNNPKFIKWFYLDRDKKEVRVCNGNGKPVTVNSIYYSSLKEAAKANNVTTTAASKGIIRNAPKYKDWQYIDSINDVKTKE